MEFDPTKAYITDDTGAVFQVLLEDGSDWDEQATRALYDAAQTKSN